MDFTLSKYNTLLGTLQRQGFSFLTFKDFILSPKPKIIILRHDVDILPLNSLIFAEIENKLRIKGTYYFRAVQKSWDEAIIKKISDLGHEVGYHYEDLSFAWAKLKAQGTILRKTSDGKAGHRAQGEELEKLVVDIGIELFKENLDKHRKIVPVKTICMHGSPMSRWDSRLLWKYYDYRDFEIIGEPYFDIDFDEVLYLTDTGRRWNGATVSVRDKAQGSHLCSSSFGGQAGLRAQGENPFQDWKVKPMKYRTENTNDEISPSRPLPLSLSSYRFHSTSDIIKAAEKSKLPDKIMMTFHPQRWTNRPVPWVKELVWQNVKNVCKYFIVKMRSG